MENHEELKAQMDLQRAETERAMMGIQTMPQSAQAPFVPVAPGTYDGRAYSNKLASCTKQYHGQEILKAGFKPISEKELEKRFAIDKFNKLVIARARKKFEKMLFKNAQNQCPDREIRISRFDYNTNEDGFYGFLKFEYRTVKDGFFGKKHGRWESALTASLPSDKFELFELKVVDINEYCEDMIPERCYANIEKAKKLGIKRFSIAYPAKVERKARPDPIIIGHLGEAWHNNDQMFEIDMWE